MRHRGAIALGAAALLWQAVACQQGNQLAKVPNNVPDPYPPCVDPTSCCSPDEIVCEGNVDNGTVCSCQGLWECNVDQTRCDQQLPRPPGGGSQWHCSWSELAYTCRAPGTEAPPGGGSWTCSVDHEQQQVVCTSWPFNPSNDPAGAGSWACRVDAELGQLICEREVHGGAGGGSSISKPGPHKDGGADGGRECAPGSKMWCDGRLYCGWGQVECNALGEWRRVDGRLDCQERADGRVPDTDCACYHFFFNPACCEEEDCVVPQGTSGRICGVSPGQLCDYCNPQNPECKVGYCLASGAGESFCGQSCGSASDCPAGYNCMPVANRPDDQCIPADFSCYR